MSACGPPCEKLTSLQHAFHLEILASGKTGKPAWKCYRDAGSRAGQKTCEAQAPRLLASPKIRAALDHHRAPAARKAQASFEQCVAAMQEILDREPETDETVVTKTGPEAVPARNRDRIAAAQALVKWNAWGEESAAERLAREYLDVVREAIAKGQGLDVAAALRALAPEVAERVAELLEKAG